MDYRIITNQILVGKATKEELLKRYGCSESTLYRCLEQGGDDKKKLLAQMRANKKAPKIYLDVSYVRSFGEMSAVMYFLGRGRIYATGLRDGGINVNEIDLKGLYQDKDGFTVVCGADNKAFMYEEAGFRTVTYKKKKYNFRRKKEEVS